MTDKQPIVIAVKPGQTLTLRDSKKTLIEVKG